MGKVREANLASTRGPNRILLVREKLYLILRACLGGPDTKVLASSRMQVILILPVNVSFLGQRMLLVLHGHYARPLIMLSCLHSHFPQSCASRKEEEDPLH